MGGFFSSLFEGSNPTLNNDIAQSGQISNFGTNLGEGDLTAGSDFYKTLLNGDPEATAKLLAPQISTIQGQGNQQIQTGAQFGNRSGGTNASNQTNIDTQRADVEQMIAQLTGQAASGLTGIGEAGLGFGLNANAQQAGESQQKMRNQQDSILGGLFGGGVSSLADLGISKLISFLNSVGGGRDSSGGGGGGGSGSDAGPV